MDMEKIRELEGHFEIERKVKLTDMCDMASKEYNKLYKCLQNKDAYCLFKFDFGGVKYCKKYLVK